MERVSARYRLAGLVVLGGGIGCEPEPTARAWPEEAAVMNAASHAAAGSGRAEQHAVVGDARPSEGDGRRARAGRSKHGGGRAEGRARDEDETGFVLHRPPPREPFVFEDAEAAGAGIRTALAWQFDAPIFRRPGLARRPLGLVRRDTRLAVKAMIDAEGCAMGWYELVDGGFICEGDGFTVSIDPAPLPEELRIVPPEATEALPYRYAKLRTPASLYWRLPSEDELGAVGSEAVRERAKGAWFVAMDRHEAVGDEAMSRTVRGFYVRDRDLEQKPAATMQGELLMGDDALPLAIVHVEGAVLVDPETGKPRGKAERFARFAVADVRERGDGSGLVVATDGFAVADESVRVARARPRPVEVAEGEQWIHIDLDEQVLVAYEGDRPVLATLVSSGKPGFEPPVGVFRVHKKYATVTMSGPDPDAGTYTVEEVPWTMYYWGSFALHGAYWHDEFGKVRSHGCTNLPPVDAHWLFHWSTPALPAGWHASVGVKGPWVVFSRESEWVSRPATSSADGQLEL